MVIFFFFQAEDGIRDLYVTGVQTCALPICDATHSSRACRSLDTRGAIGGGSVASGAIACGLESRDGARSDREIGRASCRERVLMLVGVVESEIDPPRVRRCTAEGERDRVME